MLLFFLTVTTRQKVKHKWIRFATNLFAMFANIKECKTYLAYCFDIELNENSLTYKNDLWIDVNASRDRAPNDCKLNISDGIHCNGFYRLTRKGRKRI